MTTNKKTTVIVATNNEHDIYHKRARMLQQLKKINYCYAKRAMWGILFNQTKTLQIITNGEQVFDTPLIDIAKWAITHDIPTSIVFSDSAHLQFNLTPIANRTYTEDKEVRYNPKTKTSTYQRQQSTLPAYTWQLVEDELAELKRYLKLKYFYNSTIQDKQQAAEAWRLPQEQIQNNPHLLEHMQAFTSIYAPAYGIDIPLQPNHRTATPPQWCKFSPQTQITPMTTEAMTVKQQLNNLNISYLTELYNTYRSLRYYDKEGFPMLEEYVHCPVCQRPMNTNPPQIKTIIETRTGQRTLLKDDEIYCQCCGETYTQHQAQMLLAAKQAEEDCLFTQEDEVLNYG